MDHNRHIWQMTWFRDLVLLALAALVLWVVYEVRSVATPVVVALGLAYIFNPVTTWLHERKGVPRWGSAGGLLLIVVLAMGGLAAWIVPKLVNQVMQLGAKSEDYLRVIEEYLRRTLSVELHLSNAPQQIREYLTGRVMGGGPGDGGASVIEPAVDAVGKGITVAATAAGWMAGVVSYLAVAAVIISVCFVFFSWKWADVVRWFDQFIPHTNRQRTMRMINRMDRTVSGIIRGRLIQAAVMGVVLSIGWWLAGVPYWLLLGVLGGLLNLAPFAASLSWIAAVLLAVVAQQAGTMDTAEVPEQDRPAMVAQVQQEAQDAPQDQAEPEKPASGSFKWWVLILPTAVYFIAQLLDGWVVEPIVQGKAADLGPVTVLLAVMVGGTLAGALGLLLAIPVTACVKILCQEIFFPKLRETVESMAKG